MEVYFCWLSIGLSVVLFVASVALYLDGKGGRDALSAWKSATEAQLIQQAGQLVNHGARLEVLERGGGPPPAPPPPPVSFPPAPGGLPLKPATLTRDDHPDHTRPTVEAPPPTMGEAPPTTKPTRSSPRVVPFDKQAERAAERRWTRRADEIRDDATLVSAGQGDPTSDQIRAAFHAEADAKDARDAARLTALPPVVEGEPDEDEKRPTFDDVTRAFDRNAVAALVTPVAPATKHPPPHAPPRPLGGRPTLLGGLAGAPSGPALGGNWKGPPVTAESIRAERKHRARIAAELRAQDAAEREASERRTLTPTDPGAPLDARIRRRWAELVAEAQEAGKTVGHCHTGRCMATGEGTDLCECDCDGCDLALTLLVKAEREITGAE